MKDLLRPGFGILRADLPCPQGPAAGRTVDFFQCERWNSTGWRRTGAVQPAFSLARLLLVQKAPCDARPWRALLVVPYLLAFALSASAQTPLSVESAVEEALDHNPALALGASDVEIARLHATEIRGERLPTLVVEGDVHGGTPSTYASGDARLQVVAASPIVAPQLNAELRAAKLGPDVATAATRVDRAELVLEVRSAFAEVLAREEELALQDETLVRLEGYLELVTLRHQGGHPVTADLLRAKPGWGRRRSSAPRLSAPCSAPGWS